MESIESSAYKNLISYIDINRSVNSIECFDFESVREGLTFKEFINDMNLHNDSIELNLIKNDAYSEAVIISLNINAWDRNVLMEMVIDEQKTFGGSKLFYINDDKNKILVMAVKGSMEGKLRMTINKLSKVNEKAHRMNSKIKKGNMDAYMTRHDKDKKDIMINIINKTFKV